MDLTEPTFMGCQQLVLATVKWHKLVRRVTRHDPKTVGYLGYIISITVVLFFFIKCNLCLFLLILYVCTCIKFFFMGKTVD